LNLSLAKGFVRGLVFAGVNVSVVGLYCWAMAGKVEPLKFHSEEFVMRPLMVITAFVSLFVYPLVRREESRVIRILLVYVGLVLVSVIYGINLWYLFPDGSPFTVLVAVVGGHLYGWPVFLAVLPAHWLLGRLLFPRPGGDCPG
jgi:hypothetical protein